MMAFSEEQLKRIQDKLQLLAKQHVALKKENTALQTELNDLRQQSTSFRENIDSLKQQVDILKFSNGEMEPEEKKQFEKRINAYVKEIDRCIALLGD